MEDGNAVDTQSAECGDSTIASDMALPRPMEDRGVLKQTANATVMNPEK